MATLAQIEADITRVRAALSAARLAIAYNQGDRSLQRASIADLTADLSLLTREKAELSAAAAGAENPFTVTSRWT